MPPDGSGASVRKEGKIMRPGLHAIPLLRLALAVLGSAAVLSTPVFASSDLLGSLSAVLAQAPCNTTATATLTPNAGSTISGTVTVTPTGTTASVTATINGLIAGQTPTISIPTTAGVQTVVGPAAGTTPVGAPVTVTGTVTGLPLLSSTVTVSVNNPVGGAVNIVAQGPLNCAGT